MENLDGKCVVLGVTGGIAAYKMANVASGLRKAGADVHVIMTENATQFITPLTFETLTNNRCVVDTDGPYLLQVAVIEEGRVLPMCCPGNDVDDMVLDY